MQDPNMSPAPQSMPEPAPTTSTDPVATVPPLGDSATSTGAPKKSHTGLIISIIVAIVTVIVVLVVVFAVITPNSQKSDSKKKDNNSSKEEQKENSASKTLIFGIDDKTVTISSKYSDTIKSFLDAGFPIKYIDNNQFIDVTNDTLNDYLKQTIKSNAYAHIHAFDVNDKNFATITGTSSAYDPSKGGPKNVTLGDFDLHQVTLYPTGTYTFKGKKLDTKTAGINEIKEIFGDPDSRDVEDDAYLYNNIDGFKYQFFMEKELIGFIFIRIAD